MSISFDDQTRSAIKDRLLAAQSLEALAELLTDVYGTLYPRSDDQKKVEFSPRLLRMLALTKQPRYKQFTIPKKSGGKRVIHAPRKGLLRVQRAINAALLCSFEAHDAAHGFVPGRSIATNASKHVSKPYVLNLDLKDFFPSTSSGRVRKRLEALGIHGAVAFYLTRLCCDHGALPQGAATSPTLTNLVCVGLDKQLAHLAWKHKARYTRYADDLTFSWHRQGTEEELLPAVKKAIEDFGYACHLEKERLQRRTERQEVTGLTVNERMNVRHRHLDDLRFWLSHWERHGYQRTNAYFVARKGAEAQLKYYVGGLLAFVTMVRGKDDAFVKRHRLRLSALPDVERPAQATDLVSSEPVAYNEVEKRWDDILADMEESSLEQLLHRLQNPDL